MKKLICAETAGFCFGVQRSVELAEKLIAEVGECWSFGPLIHNDDVVKTFESKGLHVTDGNISPGSHIIIRAHGVKKSVIENLQSLGALITDATCPKVKAIHKIAENATKKGRYIIIIGMHGHPEVEGISGWCENSSVVEDVDELINLFKLNPELKNMPITCVVQTTQTQSNFKTCCEQIKKLCTNIEIFDTICLATFSRQNEAAELSKKCGSMVVIGGKHSANSVHLANICEEYCKNVQFIENASELDFSKLRDVDSVGLTAGASTPAWIIKEVRNKMNDEINANAENTTAEGLSFDEMLEESLKPIYNGEKVTGIVAAISGTEVTLDIGTKYSGFIPTAEFTDSGVKIEDAVKIGDEVEAVVVRVNDVEGTAMLSKKRLDSQKFWEAIENASEEGAVIEGVVTEENKGGVVVNVKGVRVFVPASQTDLPREADLKELLKKNVKLKISEVNKSRKRVVGSIRSAARAERKALSEEFWNTVEVGKKFHGTVKSLTNYGAFVDIGGLDGMIHITELGWGKIRHPSEVVNPGDEVDCYVISFDKDNRRISLGYKDPEADPWKAFTSKFNVGDVAEVKIVKLMPFGAFAEIIPGIDGLIHISQIANRRIGKVDEALNVGDIVEAKITAIDNDNQKVSLSVRALLPEEQADEPVEEDETAEEEVPAEE